MPVTQPLPDGPFVEGMGTPPVDMADVVTFLQQKGTATDAELRAWSVSLDQYAAYNGTDETTALTTALTAAAGKTLYIPAGRTIRCAGATVPAGTTITGGGTIRIISDGTTEGRSLNCSANDITLQGIRLEMPDVTIRTGVYGLVRSTGSSRLRILDCHFGISDATFVILLNCSDFQIIGNRGIGSKADGIHITRGSTRGVVSGNILDTMGDDGISVWSKLADGATSYPVCSDITIADNVVRTTTPLGSGIAVYGGQRIRIAGNNVSGTAVYGIQVSDISDTAADNSHPSSDVTVQGNSISGTGEDGIFVGSFAAVKPIYTGIAVLDNNVSPAAAKAAIYCQYGIRSRVSGNHARAAQRGVFLDRITKSVVTGNVFTEMSDAAIYLGVCSDVTVTGNVATDSVGGIYEPNGDHNVIVGNVVVDNTSFQVSSVGTGTVNASNQTT